MRNRDMNKRLAVIVPAMNEGDKIAQVLAEVKRLSPDEIVVVVNGSTDNTADIARESGSKVIEYEEPLGNDVGRAVGAMHADADIYLFLDADLVIAAELLLPFVLDVEEGVDVALNSISWVARHPDPDAPSIARYFLNLILQRRDLGVENVLTIPHALSKHALEVIGKQTLAAPLLTNAVAIHKGLEVTVPSEINVLEMNKVRLSHLLQQGDVMPKAYERMHGDTVEAFHYLLRELGIRGGYSEGNRKRNYYKEYGDIQLHWQPFSKKSNVSIVLAVDKYSGYLRPLIDELARSDFEIIPITYGEPLHVNKILERNAIPYLSISDDIGHDVAFSIGAQIASGDVIVFHNASLPLDPEQLAPFYTKILEDETDVTINCQNYVGKLEGMHPLHIGNYFINIMAKRTDLNTSSITLPPFGIRRDVLNSIGPATLLSPCVAHLRAIETGCRISQVEEIDHFQRINESVTPVIFNLDRIYGDFMEGLYYWTQKYGFRGGLYDGNRKRDVLGTSNGIYVIEEENNRRRPNDQVLSWIMDGIQQAPVQEQNTDDRDEKE